jgi:hypothetical protein
MRLPRPLRFSKGGISDCLPGIEANTTLVRKFVVPAFEHREGWGSLRHSDSSSENERLGRPPALITFPAPTIMLSAGVPVFGTQRPLQQNVSPASVALAQ